MFWHYATECANKKKRTKKKALNTTWDEESSKEEKDPSIDTSETVNSKFVAFMAKSQSNNDTNEYHVDEMLDQEKDYEELHHTTYANHVRMTKYGNKITIKFKDAQENSTLKNELEQALKKVHLLESRKNCIAENLTTKGQKFKKAEQEIETLKIELQKVNS